MICNMSTPLISVAPLLCVHTLPFVHSLQGVHVNNHAKGDLKNAAQTTIHTRNHS